MNRVSFAFDGAAVLVTGGTSGIGHAIAATFADAGARVTVTGTRETAADYETDLARFDYRRLERFVVPLLAASFVLLVLVLVPPFGQEINGTRRWLRLGPVSFQPVELAKLSLLLPVASHVARRVQAGKSLPPVRSAAA